MRKTTIKKPDLYPVFLLFLIPGMALLAGKRGLSELSVFLI